MGNLCISTHMYTNEHDENMAEVDCGLANGGDQSVLNETVNIRWQSDARYRLMQQKANVCECVKDTRMMMMIDPRTRGQVMNQILLVRENIKAMIVKEKARE